MKSLILALSILVSGSAFAIDQNSSWNEIRNGNTYSVDTPAINFRGNGLQVSPFGVCVDGDFLRTKGMVEKCVSRDNRDGDCSASVFQYEFLPITRRVKTCVKYSQRGGGDRECVRFATRSVTTPLSYTFDVYKRTGARNGGLRYLFSKDYDIMACR